MTEERKNKSEIKIVAEEFDSLLKKMKKSKDAPARIFAETIEKFKTYKTISNRFTEISISDKRKDNFGRPCLERITKRVSKTGGYTVAVQHVLFPSQENKDYNEMITTSYLFVNGKKGRLYECGNTYTFDIKRDCVSKLKIEKTLD